MWSIVEEGCTEVPGFDPAWLPPAAYRYVTPKISRAGQRVELAAENYAGVIPLRNGDTLRITPKIGTRALGRMILVTEGLDRNVAPEFDASAKLGHDGENDVSWLTLLARSFTDALRGIEKRSLRSGRTVVQQRLDHARGRIEVVATLQSLARHETDPVHCAFAQATFDTPENRLLAAAARRLLVHVDLPSESRQVAQRWARRFRGDAPDRDELATIVAGLRSARFAGSRGYYIPALVMAHLLLAAAGLNLDSNEVVPGEAILVNTADIFEKYVRALISRAVEGDGLVVAKGTTPPQTLFADGTCRLDPDVVISDAQGVRLLLDAKYKPTPSVPVADFYQIYAYLRAFGVSTGVLIMPGTSPEAPSLLWRTTVDGKRVVEARVPLADWHATEAWVGPMVRALLQGCGLPIPPPSPTLRERS